MLEPHFRLRGMNVHIYIFIRNRQEQNDHGEAARRQNVPVRLADRMKDDLVAHEPAVDEEEHRIPVVLLNVRPGREQMNLQTAPAELFLIFDELVKQILAEDLKNPFTEARRDRRRQNFETRALQQKLDIRKRQS